MNGIVRFIRDTWRGYTDNDVASLELKLMNARPYQTVGINQGEANALAEGHGYGRRDNEGRPA
jgi:hypothetical protein